MPRRIQPAVFLVTGASWVFQLLPTLYPQGTQTSLSIANRIMRPKLFQRFFSRPNSTSWIYLSTYMAAHILFNGSQNGLKQSVKDALINPITMNMCELVVYLYPWFSIKQYSTNPSKLFTNFLTWFASIFTCNMLSLEMPSNLDSTPCNPIFHFTSIRNIPYFTMLTVSLGLLSPSINPDFSTNNYSDKIFTATAAFDILLFILTMCGVEKGNTIVTQGLTHWLIPLPFLYFKPIISLQFLVFYFLPTFYYFDYIMFKPEMTEIVKGVFLGNMKSVTKENIEKNKIKRILEVHDDYKNETRFENVEYLSLEFADRDFVRVIDYFEQTNMFIDASVNTRENVLVHCSAGVSRSASLVTAYLIHVGYSFDGAVAKMKELRESYDPTTAFVRQLKEFADTKEV